MVAKCANPACNREFRDLSKGRLFLLPPTHFYSDSMKLSDYCYWLCPHCDATYTITRCGSEVLVGERGLGSAYSAPAPPRRSKGPGRTTLRSYTQAG